MLRSVWSSGTGDPTSSGENDLVVEARWSGDEARYLLVEDKVHAAFQDTQAQRYAARVAGRRGDTRCVLVAPASHIEAHPGEVALFESAGTTIAIEDIADRLDELAGTSESGGSEGRRLAWRAARLRALCAEKEPTPSDELTVAFAEWCVGWVADNAEGMEVLPQYTRTVNTTWVQFGEPAGLTWKCNQGRVDLTLHYQGVDPGETAVRALVGDRLPDGFEVEVDSSDNTVLRRDVPRVLPSEGVTAANQDAVETGLRACRDIARWVHAGGVSGLEPYPDES